MSAATQKLPVKLPAEIVPQAHGGALRQGGGNPQRNGGRPPSAIRERLRGSFEERIDVLEEIADDPMQSPADRTRAIDLLAKYGLGTTKEISTEDVAGKLRETIAIIRRQLPQPVADALLTEMREVWK